MTRVLVIDDEVLLLRATARVLAKKYEVVPVATAEEALKAVGEVDIVLSDYSMPGENGVQLAHRLRENGFRGLYLLLTAVAEASELDGALATGILDGVIAKPWEPGTLVDQVEARRATFESKLTPAVKVDPREIPQST